MADTTIRDVLDEAQRLSADPNRVREARRQWLALRVENQRLQRLVDAFIDAHNDAVKTVERMKDCDVTHE